MSFSFIVYQTGAPPPMLTTAALFAKRQEKLFQKKERIAELALLLIENPEENVGSVMWIVLCVHVCNI